MLHRDSRGINLTRLAWLAIPVLLAGCAKGTADLQQWVNAEKNKRGQPIEPLPVIRTFETFEYESEELKEGQIVARRDPFRPSADELPEEADGEGLRPDPTRRREILEAFPLDALAMVGTLGEGEGKRGLVRAPDRVIHRVEVGHYIGQNYGRITHIRDNEIELVELVPDGTGAWMERKATMALRER
ncbi:MAG TPA: pilus assembly protein PilP [Xanthomonadaceae bacterium]|nr:pilus assembly protein PilP [Xanthomonadaceae bacterium]